MLIDKNIKGQLNFFKLNNKLTDVIIGVGKVN